MLEVDLCWDVLHLGAENLASSCSQPKDVICAHDIQVAQYFLPRFNIHLTFWANIIFIVYIYSHHRKITSNYLLQPQISENWCTQPFDYVDFTSTCYVIKNRHVMILHTILENAKFWIWFNGNFISLKQTIVMSLVKMITPPMDISAVHHNNALIIINAKFGQITTLNV